MLFSGEFVPSVGLSFPVSSYTLLLFVTIGKKKKTRHFHQSLYSLASYRGRPSPISLGRASGGLSILLSIWVISNCVCRFPNERYLMVSFSGVCDILLPLVFLCGTTGAVLHGPQTSKMCWVSLLLLSLLSFFHFNGV